MESTTPFDAAEHEKILKVCREREHHQGRGFVADGPIDPALWPDAQPRVLLLLKEAYWDQSTEWDLCNALRREWGGPRWQIWWRAAYWVRGIQALWRGNHVDPNRSESNDADATSALFSAAVVNVKKSGGTSQSEHEELVQAVARDGDVILDQVRILSPDIIVCGGTWEIASNLLTADQLEDRIWHKDDVLLIDFYHPANRYPNALNYYALLYLVRRGRSLLK